MENIFALKEVLLKYHGVDWLVTITVFLGIFLLGEKRSSGFILGMISTVLGLIFSYQIGSLANGIASVALFIVYLRGFIKWYSENQPSRPEPQLEPIVRKLPDGNINKP
jgi:hypothetical protein